MNDVTNDTPEPSRRTGLRRRIVVGTIVALGGVGLVAGVASAQRQPEVRGRVAEHEAPRGQDGPNDTIAPATTTMTAPAATTPLITMPPAAIAPSTTVDDRGHDDDRADDRGDDRGPDEHRGPGLSGERH